jgi:hypothetical protein
MPDFAKSYETLFNTHCKDVFWPTGKSFCVMKQKFLISWEVEKNIKDDFNIFFFKNNNFLNAL